MTTSTRRDEHRLSDIVVDPVLYPVTDELAGLEHLIPEAPSAVERYAAFWSQRPALLPIRARAGAHAGELKRFIGLARASIGEIEPSTTPSGISEVNVSEASAIERSTNSTSTRRSRQRRPKSTACARCPLNRLA